jgi:transcriptional regulator with XRE-family HTH domain
VEVVANIVGKLPTYKYLLCKYPIYHQIIFYMAEIEGFAERIFSLRRSVNKNQEEIGTALGLTKSGVSSFENGKSIPSPENLVKLAVLFNVSVDYLLTGRDSIGKTESSKGIESSNFSTSPSAQDASMERQLHQLSAPDSVRQHYNEDNSNEPTVTRVTLPVFDQSQIDKRFLTELDRLLKAKSFPSYKVWAQAVDVSPSYVAAIERGRYHFNIDLLYNTARHFPDFDFIYVVFGSALSARSEPTEVPKRERGRRPQEEIPTKAYIMLGGFREKLREIIISNEVSEREFWLGSDIDLARDNEVEDLYVSEYGPITDYPKYYSDMKMIAYEIIKELAVASGKK